MSIPTHAIWNRHRVRVLEYLGNGKWLILDHRDQYREVHNWMLTFTK